MLKKITSGGQTGADQAALDVALKLGIPHGGWIPKGRLTEAGPLNGKYQLQETENANYNKRTAQNVIDSDGTLIISHGTLTGGSEYTREMAAYHNRPWLHIDLNATIAFHAAQQISSWIKEHNIQVLNVAGSRASKDAKIYRAVADLLETVLYLDIVDSSIPNPFAAYGKSLAEMESFSPPRTVDQAVEKLLAKLSLREKTMIANIPEDNLQNLYHSLEEYIKNEFRLWLANDELMESCRSMSGKHDLNEYNAALTIIRALWNRLQKTNVLRIVK
ncbi:MAG: putative molybdenum carrier protein [Desulfobacterales bacterium]|uniref:Putative molybdenum carrier protein n=1 Tax=Candidatus Desulfatibia profunda TaxID=2841695 RepID=A0A8J6TNH1_9BACT|nr:putative molybdenum carrier protein [Candidatus Desulfatibia profunda]MBL7179839.1 putative molybdenum carrier protein [Desulfobacterales bacterium]